MLIILDVIEGRSHRIIIITDAAIIYESSQRSYKEGYESGGNWLQRWKLWKQTNSIPFFVFENDNVIIDDNR